MPRPSNTAQRRDEIAQGLATVMAGTGYDGATINAIAAEAGVAPGGVHYHFSSKSEILLHLVEGLVATAQRRVDGRAQAAQDGRGRLNAVLDGLLAVDGDAAPDGVATWALVGAEAIRSEEVREVHGRWMAHAAELLREAFTAACHEEQRHATGATAASASLVALVEGYFSLAASTSGIVPAGSAAAAARRVAGALVDGQPKAT